jgi:hypothetical protein
MSDENETTISSTIPEGAPPPEIKLEAEVTPGELIWREPPFPGTKQVAAARPSARITYHINKADEGSYWLVVLVANEETGKGTINYHLGDGLTREEAERKAADDWAEGARPK